MVKKLNSKDIKKIKIPDIPSKKILKTLHNTEVTKNVKKKIKALNKEINSIFNKNKLKEIDKLHRKTEINFKIQSLWDGPIDFYFGYNIVPNHVGHEFRESESFEKFENGIDWLLKKYKEVKNEV